MEAPRNQLGKHWPWLASALVHGVLVAAFVWAQSGLLPTGFEGGGGELLLAFATPAAAPSSGAAGTPPPAATHRPAEAFSASAEGVVATPEPVLEAKPPEPLAQHTDSNDERAVSAEHADADGATQAVASDSSSEEESETGASSAATPGSAGESAPVLIVGELRRPPYPRWAREQGWEGRVLLEVEVLANGSLGAVHVRESSGHAPLDAYTLEWARESLRALHFEPARVDGRRVPSTLSWPVFYDLY